MLTRCARSPATLDKVQIVNNIQVLLPKSERRRFAPVRPVMLAQKRRELCGTQHELVHLGSNLELPALSRCWRTNAGESKLISEWAFRSRFGAPMGPNALATAQPPI
jgi:hypothetical protein